jgi:hypothetical protein
MQELGQLRKLLAGLGRREACECAALCLKASAAAIFTYQHHLFVQCNGSPAACFWSEWQHIAQQV